MDYPGFFWWLLSSIMLVQLVVLCIYVARAQGHRIAGKDSEKKMTVLIAFRNEEDRIGSLLKALNEQFRPSHGELILINDCSNDHTEALLRSILQVPYRLIEMPHHVGKKKALRAGVHQAAEDLILTLDADVHLPGDFFEKLSTLPCTDLTILPVQTTGKSIVGKLSEIEFDWLQLLTFGGSTPTLCNGAALMFRKSAYLSVEERRTDWELPSGDDVFLLQALREQNAGITRCFSPELKVATASPNSIDALIAQRRRWFSKTSQMNSAPFWGAFLLLVLTQYAGLSALILSFFSPVFIVPVLVKVWNEFLVRMVFRSKSAILNIGLTLIHQIWYPFYGVFLLVKPTKSKDRWA